MKVEEALPANERNSRLIVESIPGFVILRSMPGQGTEIQIILNNPTKPKPDDGGEHA